MNFEFWPNKKGWISNFDPIKRGELWILNDPIKRGYFLIDKKGRILYRQKGGNFEFWPSYFIKITDLLSFRTLHLVYPKLVGTPCITRVMPLLLRQKSLQKIIFQLFTIFSYRWGRILWNIRPTDRSLQRRCGRPLHQIDCGFGQISQPG